MTTPIVTRWDDLGMGDQEFPDTRPPHWFDRNAKPCGCVAKDESAAKQLRIHEGYSDSTYIQWVCPDCGHVWCTYLEG